MVDMLKYLETLPMILPWSGDPERYLDSIASDVIIDLEIPSGTLLVFEPDTDLEPIPNESSSRLMAIASVPS